MSEITLRSFLVNKISKIKLVNRNTLRFPIKSRITKQINGNNSKALEYLALYE